MCRREASEQTEVDKLAVDRIQGLGFGRCVFCSCNVYLFLCLFYVLITNRNRIATVAVNGITYADQQKQAHGISVFEVCCMWFDSH